MIKRFNFTRRDGSVSGSILVYILVALFFFAAAEAQQWDKEAAIRAYEQACKLRSEIDLSSDSARDLLLKCAATYRRVYLNDPHSSYASEAIYEEGVLYQEAGDAFGDRRHYTLAAKRFEFLVKDYGGNRQCPDALKRLVTIYAQKLNDPQASQSAYERLKTNYRFAHSTINEAETKLKFNSPEPQKPEKSSESREIQTSKLVSVQNIRFQSKPEHTRIMIDLDGEASYSRGLISNPDRIYFDISNARLAEGFRRRNIAVGDALLKQIRTSQNRPATVRVVLDVLEAQHCLVRETQDPSQLVIELKPESSAKIAQKAPDSSVAAKKSSNQASGSKSVAIKSAGHSLTAKTLSKLPQNADTVRTRYEKNHNPPLAVTTAAESLTETSPSSTASGINNPSRDKGNALSADLKIELPQSEKPRFDPSLAPASPTLRGTRTLTRMLGLKIGRIVLDPGHGGHDLGAVGPGGSLEKNLTLSLARQLKCLIEDKIGSEVILTRNDDSFVSLEDRTAIANRHRADLFISIHANYSRHRSVSGAETYYLDFAGTKAERDVAARENASAVSNVSDLENLVKKIAVADKSAESRELASMLQNRLHTQTRSLFPAARNRGVRRAPFVVLIGANMPSVLAEVAFLSNPKDEETLKEESNQNVLSRALYSGIESYIKSLGTVVVQNQRSTK